MTVEDPIVVTLRAERERRGLTQQQLGERLGRKTYQSVWQWENGVTSPGLANLREWARALGYDLVLIPVGEPALSGYRRSGGARSVEHGAALP